MSGPQQKSFAVTTSHRPSKATIDLAKHFAKIGSTFCERNDLSQKALADTLKVGPCGCLYQPGFLF